MDLKKNIDGFSLMEVMIVMLVMTIIALNMATNTRNEYTAALRIQSANDMNAIVNHVGSILADPAKCTAYLGATNFTTGPESGETTINIGTNGTISQTVVSIHDAPNAIPAAQPIYSAALFDDADHPTVRNYNTATKYGNSNIAIHSFVFSGWLRPRNPLTPTTTIEGTSTATLTINFFRKAKRIWTWNTSMWTGKNIALSVTTNAAGVLTDCRALYYSSPTVGNGIKACPVSNNEDSTSLSYKAMTLVGNPGENGAYCITTVAKGPSSYVNAIRDCNSISDPIYGTAHLCNFKEWNKACLIKTGGSAPANFSPMIIANASAPWEWIASAPTSSVVGGSTPVGSNVMKIGAAISGLAAYTCINAKVDVNPYNIPENLTTACNCATAQAAFNAADAITHSVCDSQVANAIFDTYAHCLDDPNWTTDGNGKPLSAFVHTNANWIKWNTQNQAAIALTTACAGADMAIVNSGTACVQAANSVAAKYRCCISR